jgi:O-antigen/teichoic acid export membrane protein
MWKNILIQAFPFGILMGLGLLHSRVDIVMLSRIKGPVEPMKAIGYYSPPHLVFTAIMLLVESMRTALFPMISSNFQENFNLVIRTYYFVFKGILYFVSIPILFFFLFLSGPFIDLFFSPEYGESTFVMQILAIVYALQAFNLPIITVLMNSQNLFKFVPMVLSAAILNISLNAVLIPRYSFRGATIATLITVSFIFLVKLIFIKKTFKGLSPFPKISFKIIPVCIGLFGYIYFIKQFNLIVAVSTGLIIYYVSLFAFGIIDKDEREKLKQLNIFRKWGRQE